MLLATGLPVSRCAPVQLAWTGRIEAHLHRSLCLPRLAIRLNHRRCRLRHALSLATLSYSASGPLRRVSATISTG